MKTCTDSTTEPMTAEQYRQLQARFWCTLGPQLWVGAPLNIRPANQRGLRRLIWWAR